MFIRYMHIERLGTDETENINMGTTFVFPKIDGTNSSIWKEDSKIFAGSRNRELTEEKDNANFYKTILADENIKNFFNDFPDWRLFGEWLVPHSLKTYNSSAWKKFYIFDVIDAEHQYVPYNTYKDILPKYNLEFIPCIAKVHNGTYEQFINILNQNQYLIEDGKGLGEGIVIKNYEFKNKYGRVTWAKIVRSEFKDLHRKTMGEHVVEGKKIIEDEIVEHLLTKAMIEKEYEKIKLIEKGWSSKLIPRLLNTVYHEFIVEEMWNIVKKHKQPKIDFKTLQFFTNKKIKETLKELF